MTDFNPWPIVTIGPWDADGTRSVREQWGSHVDVVTIERRDGTTPYRDIVVADLSRRALTPARARQLAADILNAADDAEAEWRGWLS
ncbi:hypothetical protein ACRU43_12840 [Mycobacterium colombiense]